MVNVSCYLFLFKNDHPNSRSILKKSTSKEKFHQPRGGQKGEEKGRWGGWCFEGKDEEERQRRRKKRRRRWTDGRGYAWLTERLLLGVHKATPHSAPPPNTHTSKCIVTLCLKTLPFLFLDFPGLFLFADRWGLHSVLFHHCVSDFSVHIKSMSTPCGGRRDSLINKNN